MSEALADVVMAAIETVTAPLVARLAALEAAGVAGPAGPPGAPGAPGLGLKAALLDAAGELVLTFSDGTLQKIGRVQGTDGAPGRDGADGAPGLALEDLEVTLDLEARELVHTYRRGALVKIYRWAIPLVIYRGVFDGARTYAPGDQVTHKGSTWIAKQPTAAGVAPDEYGAAGEAWQLCAKRGPTGKQGPRGEPGAAGAPGKDLTQVDFAGRKW